MSRGVFFGIVLFALTACSHQIRDYDETPLLLRPLSAVIRRHVDRDTHIDGPQCRFYPTCAHYARKAIEQSPFTGLLSVIDRMFFREFGGFLEEKYMPVSRRLSEDPRYYDPISDTLPLFRSQRPSLLREDFFR